MYGEVEQPRFEGCSRNISIVKRDVLEIGPESDTVAEEVSEIIKGKSKTFVSIVCLLVDSETAFLVGEHITQLHAPGTFASLTTRNKSCPGKYQQTDDYHINSGYFFHRLSLLVAKGMTSTLIAVLGTSKFGL